MKKLYILITALTLMLGVNTAGISSVAAQTADSDTDVTVQITLGASSKYIAVFVADTYVGVKSASIYIPPSGYNRTVYEANTATLYFTDANAGSHSVPFVTNFGDWRGGLIEFDYEALGLEDYDIIKFTLTIPLAASAIPGGLLDYFNDNVYTRMTYLITERDSYFIRSTGTGWTRLQETYDLPVNTYNVTVDFNNLDYHVETTNGYKSAIQLLDASGSLLENFYIDDLITFDSNIVQLDIPYSTATYDVDDVKQAQIISYVDDNNTYTETAQWNTNFKIYTNYREMVTVEYYSVGDHINSANGFIGFIPPEYTPTPPEGFEFTNWTYNDGAVLQSYTAISDDYKVDGVIKLFAQYRLLDAIDSPNTVDPELEGLTKIELIFRDFGIDEQNELVMVYVIVIVATTLAVMIFLKNAILASVINLLITAMFAYWAILPLYIIALGVTISLSMIAYETGITRRVNV